MRKKYQAILGLSVWLAMVVVVTPATVRAVSVALIPTTDAFVSGANPSSNYGAAGALSVAASGSANGEFQSVMRFDTSSAKTMFDATYGAGNWTIQSATLTLTAASPNNPIFNTSVAGNFAVNWMQNTSWTEGTGMPNGATTDGITYTTLLSTYVSASDQSVGTFSFGGATSGTQPPITLTLSSGLTSGLTTGGVVGFRLFAADTSVSYLFNARSIGTASSRPQLTITATPEPTGMSILALAAVGLLRRRSHR